MTYQPKVYRKQGGAELVVASGGKILVEEGGVLEGTGLARNAAVAADELAIPVTAAPVRTTAGPHAEAPTLAHGPPGQMSTNPLVLPGGGAGPTTPTHETGLGCATSGSRGVRKRMYENVESRGCTADS